MKQEDITIMECLDRYRFGQRATIEDGQVTGFRTELLKDRIMNAILIVLVVTAVAGFLFLIIGVPILQLFFGIGHLTAHAEDNPYGAPFPAESTAYCYGEITASGKPGDLLGIYELLDTGGDEKV